MDRSTHAHCNNTGARGCRVQVAGRLQLLVVVFPHNFFTTINHQSRLVPPSLLSTQPLSGQFHMHRTAVRAGAFFEFFGQIERSCSNTVAVAVPEKMSCVAILESRPSFPWLFSSIERADGVGLRGAIWTDGDEEIVKDKLHFLLILFIAARYCIFTLRFVVRLVLG